LFHVIDGSEESAEAEYDGLLASCGSSAATSVGAFNRVVGSPLLSNVRRVVFSKVETAIQLHAVLVMPCAVIEMGMADGAAAYMQQLLLQKLPLHPRALSSGNPSVASVLKPETRSIIELGAMAASNNVVDISCDSSSSCSPSAFQFSDVLLHVLDRGSPRSPEVAAAWDGIVQGGLLSISFPPGMTAVALQTHHRQYCKHQGSPRGARSTTHRQLEGLLALESTSTLDRFECYL